MRVFIATPCFGGMVTERYLQSMIATLAHRDWSVPGVQFRLHTVAGEALIPHARNQLAGAFQRSACDALLWVDADTEFTPRDVDLLIASDKAMVGGVYPRKEIDWSAVASAARAGKAHPEEAACVPVVQPQRAALSAEDVVPVHGVGLGFTLVRREVFEAVAPLVDAYYDPQHGAPVSDYFAPEVVDGQYYGEDYAFCARWRRAGGEVWAHFGVRLGHVGVHVFRGDPRARNV